VGGIYSKLGLVIVMVVGAVVFTIIGNAPYRLEQHTKPVVTNPPAAPATDEPDGRTALFARLMGELELQGIDARWRLDGEEVVLTVSGGNWWCRWQGVQRFAGYGLGPERLRVQILDRRVPGLAYGRTRRRVEEVQQAIAEQRRAFLAER